jgi:hypothetical protein
MMTARKERNGIWAIGIAKFVASQFLQRDAGHGAPP